MNKWPPVVIFTFSFLIIFYALYLVLKENIQVAPHATGAAEARLHNNMKNTTRFAGSIQSIRRQIYNAVYLEDTLPTFPDNWIDEAQLHLLAVPSSSHQILLPGSENDSSIAWALPGLFWAAYASCPVTFIPSDPQSGSIDSLLQPVIRNGLPVFVLAPASVINDSIIDRLRKTLPVTRVSGKTYADHAVAVAEYRDPAAGFGWGRTYWRRNGYFEFVIATPSEARLVISALPFAQSNLASFLFTADDGSVPAATDTYLWKQRADWFVTPAEGPFRHLWIIGNQTTYASQARLDFALEKGPYPSRGPTAMGPIEGLAIVFITLGLGCGIFVLLHGMLLLSHISLGMRLAWAGTAALTPVLGLLLYFAAYRRSAMKSGHMYMFTRPGSILAASATAMGFGYGAPIMMAIAFLFVYFGIPILFGDWAIRGWTFLFGAGMVVMMITMWAGAILLAWPLAQFPMHAAMMPDMPGRKLLRKTLLTTTISMSAVSLGMMTTSWWMQMWRLPMMPHEDEILLMGSLWLASFIGFLVAWPLNYPLVRTGLKSGGM